MAKMTIGITFILLTAMFFSPNSKAGCITHHNSHLRESPTTSSEILDVMPKFHPFNFIERSGEWFKIETRNQTGWAHEKVVNKSLDCLLILSTEGLRCNIGKQIANHNFYYLESFRVLKKEIGCNYVQDRKNNKFWIKSYNIWPKDQSKKLEVFLLSSFSKVI